MDELGKSESVGTATCRGIDGDEGLSTGEGGLPDRGSESARVGEKVKGKCGGWCMVVERGTEDVKGGMKRRVEESGEAHACRNGRDGDMRMRDGSVVNSIGF